MTDPKQQIIEKIRELYENRIPLNLVSVKRHFPELVKAVYSTKPYWGWKQALADAGISYNEIIIELEEYVECPICGKEVKNLANHARYKHEVTPDEMKETYPGVPMFSDTSLARKMNSSYNAIQHPDFLPHWEPLWTIEYALDRIMEYAKLGFAMNQSSFQDRDNATWLFSTRNLKDTSIGWDDVLGYFDFDVKSIRLYNGAKYPSKASIISELQRRRSSGLSLTPSILRYGAPEEVDQVLYSSVTKFFKTYSDALKAAKIEWNDVVKFRQNYQQPEDVIKELTRRDANDESISTVDVFQQDRQLFDASIKFFGDWQTALTAANLTLIRKKRKLTRTYIGKTNVIEEIQDRYKKGLPLSHGEICNGASRNLPLYTSSAILFGTWKAAVEVAGIDYAKVSIIVRKYTSKVIVLEEIRLRHKLGKGIRRTDLRKGEYMDNTLLSASKRHFGDWKPAVIAAGFDYSKIKGQKKK